MLTRPIRRTAHITSLIALFALALPACEQQSTGDQSIVHPHAQATSQPSPVNQVEDAAVWIHPKSPAKSLLLVSNKMRGIELHDPAGFLLKTPPPSNADYDYRGIDVLYDFPLPDGKTVDLALLACRTAQGVGVKVFAINPDKRRLVDVTANHFIKVLHGGDPLGLCAYHSRRTGRCSFFVSTEDGLIEQYQLDLAPAPDNNATTNAPSRGLSEAKPRIPPIAPPITAHLLRSLNRHDKVKALVTDPQRGLLYFAEEHHGVFRSLADPGTSDDDALQPPLRVITIGEHGLIGDITALALYDAGVGRGYLILVSQGPRGSRSRFLIYQRQGDNNYLLTVDPAADSAARNCSALVVTNRPTAADFPQGFLAAKNRITSNASETFEIYPWPAVAAPAHLLIVPDAAPRK